MKYTPLMVIGLFCVSCSHGGTRGQDNLKTLKALEGKVARQSRELETLRERNRMLEKRRTQAQGRPLQQAAGQAPNPAKQTEWQQDILVLSGKKNRLALEQLERQMMAQRAGGQDMALLYLALADVNLADRMFPEALKNYTRAHERASEPQTSGRALSGKGHVYLRMGLLEQAEATFTELSRDPEFKLQAEKQLANIGFLSSGEVRR